MKKYFMKETGNEVKFGDTIELDFIKKGRGKIEKTHINCPFHPSLVPLLKKRGLIEVKEVEEDEEYEDIHIKSEEELIQFLLDNITGLINVYEELENRVTMLEEEVSKLLNKDGKAA